MKKLLLKWFNQLQLNFLEDWVDDILPFFRVFLLILLGYVAWFILKHATRKIVHYAARSNRSLDQEKRARTLMRLLNNLGLTLICAMVFLQALSEFGYSLAPLMATAGVAGLVMALGMQNIIKDVTSGLLLLVEGQIREGDVVEISGKTGTVEEIKLRFVRLRDIAGIVHYLPSSGIGVISNHTKYYSYAVIDLDLDAKQSYDAAIVAISKAAELISASPNYKPHILGGLDILGLEKLARDVMTIRFRMKVREHQANAIRRALLLEVKKQLELSGIALASTTVSLANELIAK